MAVKRPKITHLPSPTWNRDVAGAVNSLSTTVENGFGVNVKDFGARGDGETDDGQAFIDAIAHLKSIAVNQDAYYQGSPRLFIPSGLYNLGTTTLDITHTLTIEGESTVYGNSSRLKWTGDCTGIRIQAYNTSGASDVVAAGFNSGSYTTIRSLGLIGPYFNNANFTGHTESEAHAIHARSNYVIEDVYIDGFAGDGLHVNTSAGAGGEEEGNSNGSFVNRLRVTNVRNGAYINGADANACTFIGIIGTYCRQWTVWDSSFLGNGHIGHHSANAGLVPGVSPSMCSYGGNRYCVVAGQETAASTNAPSGTADDSSYWLYLGAGAADSSLNIIAWTSGLTWRAAGCYHTDNENAYCTMVGVYNESGEGRAQYAAATTYVNGLYGSGNPYTLGTGFGGSGKRIVIAGLAVVGERQAGWTAPTGGSYRGTWDTSTVSTATLAEVVKALIEDLGTTASGHGLIDA